jgi:hypothetical protein
MPRTPQATRPPRWFVAWVGGLLAVTGVAWSPALAASPPTGSTLSRAFTTAVPASPTGVALGVTYRQPGDPQAKPPAVTGVRIGLPTGTTVHLGAVPVCSASDPTIELLGDAACPRASRVGSGTLSAVTGFGPPVDPFRADIGVFNDASGFVEVVTLPGMSLPALDTRVTVTGDTLTAQVPPIPGGPPDFHTAVRDIALTFSASNGYVTTPPSCPPTHQWESTAQFSFADGTAQSAIATTPCKPLTTAPARVEVATLLAAKPAVAATLSTPNTAAPAEPPLMTLTVIVTMVLLAARERRRRGVG